MVDVNSTLFIQIINFLVLLLVLKKFAWGPLLQVLHDRTDKIQNNIRQADEDRAQAAEMKKEYEQKLSDARKRAQEITDSATQRSEAEHRARVEETQQEIEQMKAAAKAQLQAEREEAAKKMKGQMVALSLAAATKLMGRNMDDAANEALVGDFIDSLSIEKLGDLSCLVCSLPSSIPGRCSSWHRRKGSSSSTGRSSSRWPRISRGRRS